MLGWAIEIDATTTRAVTVSDGDWPLLPLIEAPIVALPGATAVTMNVPVVAPAATVTEDGTVMTVVLLLESETFAPPDGAAVPSVTVPCAVAPALTLDALSEIEETPIVFVGLEGEELPHCTVVRIVATSAAPASSWFVRMEKLVMCRPGINIGATSSAGENAREMAEFGGLKAM